MSWHPHSPGQTNGPCQAACPSHSLRGPLSSRPQCPASRIQPPPPRPPTEGHTCEAAGAPCTTPSEPRRPRRPSRPMAGKWHSLLGGPMHLPSLPRGTECLLVHDGLDRPTRTAPACSLARACRRAPCRVLKNECNLSCHGWCL